jgi:hypothetical protein
VESDWAGDWVRAVVTEQIRKRDIVNFIIATRYDITLDGSSSNRSNSTASARSIRLAFHNKFMQEMPRSLQNEALVWPLSLHSRISVGQSCLDLMRAKQDYRSGQERMYFTVGLLCFVVGLRYIDFVLIEILQAPK